MSAAAMGALTNELRCYPDPTSVKGRVLGALLLGELLSHFDCWRRFGSSRLAHHIYVLRRHGWPICMEEVDVLTSDGGRKATIGVYRLDADTIAEAGAEGRRYATEAAAIERGQKVA